MEVRLYYNVMFVMICDVVAFSLSQEACNSLDNLVNNSDSKFVRNCTKDAACARIMCESLQLTFDLCEEPPRAHLASQEFGLNVTTGSNKTITTESHGTFSVTFSPFSAGVYFEVSLYNSLNLHLQLISKL